MFLDIYKGNWIITKKETFAQKDYHITIDEESAFSFIGACFLHVEESGSGAVFHGDGGKWIQKWGVGLRRCIVHNVEVAIWVG